MRKVIQFKKELPFKTSIGEITSISLEHTITTKEIELISGIFYISGEYKMMETSINKEAFDFELPFDIALDSRFDLKNSKFDIDDFYYEIINGDTLKVNIDVFIEGLTTEQRCIEDEEFDSIKPDKQKEAILNLENLDDDPVIDINDINNNEVVAKIKNNDNINILENISSNETYATYYVYTVLEDDTLDKILEQFKVSKEEVANYNDIENIKVNDKLIIPTNNE